MAILKYALVTIPLLVACATGSDAPAGGGHNLPQIHILPCEIPEDAIVLDNQGVDHERPWAMLTETGEQIIWTGDSGTIVRSDKPDYVLKPELEWENGSISEPALLEQDGGSWLMAYVVGKGAAIGLASSVDSEAWIRREKASLEPLHSWEQSRVTSPSLVDDQSLDRLLLFYVGGDGQGIGVAQSVDQGASFQRLIDGPILTQLEDETAPEFSRAAITGASCSISFSPLNRQRYECYFSASGHIGYAAGFELDTFSRFQLNPFLEANGLNMADPMRLANTLFFSRYRNARSPTSGRVIGIAVFGEQ